MESLKIFFTISLMVSSLAWAKPAETTYAPVPQDGPNCFNTVLRGKGLEDRAFYTSEAELQFFLNSFCTEQAVPVTERQPGDIITFQTDASGSSGITHAALALENKMILEKNSLYGSNTTPFDLDPAPGLYLQHPLQNSIYFNGLFAKLYQKNLVRVFRCDDSQKIKKSYEVLTQSPDIQTLLEFKKTLSHGVQMTSRADVESFLLKTVVPAFQQLNILGAVKAQPAKANQLHYKKALAKSIAYQWHVLNCSESLKKYDECYVPQLQESVKAVDLLYEEIH